MKTTKITLSATQNVSRVVRCFGVCPCGLITPTNSLLMTDVLSYDNGCYGFTNAGAELFGSYRKFVDVEFSDNISTLDPATIYSHILGVKFEELKNNFLKNPMPILRNSLTRDISLIPTNSSLWLACFRIYEVQTIVFKDKIVESLDVPVSPLFWCLPVTEISCEQIRSHQIRAKNITTRAMKLGSKTLDSLARGGGRVSINDRRRAGSVEESYLETLSAKMQFSGEALTLFAELQMSEVAPNGFGDSLFKVINPDNNFMYVSGFIALNSQSKIISGNKILTSFKRKAGKFLKDFKKHS